jgi:RimJ/RimL family protein N-acetyltransferase
MPEAANETDQSPVRRELIHVPAELRTERLIIRAMVPDDAPALFASIDESRATLRPWLPWVDSTRTVDDSRVTIAGFVARWSTREDLVYGIFDAATGRHIGGTGLHRIDWQLRAFEIGYWLSSAAVGHGYMLETVRELTRMAFEELDARRVEIRLDPTNLRSGAIPRRLGFVHEGTLRDSLLDHHGEVRSTEVHALVPADRQLTGR